MKKLINAVIYIRVSSVKQVDNESLETQLTACQAYASKIGVDVVKVFNEEGESAKTADRTQLLGLLEFCRKNKGKIQALIVWKVDRLARNISDHYFIKRQLLEYGVDVHSATERVSDDPTGKAMEAMAAMFAEYDNALRSQRSLENMKTSFRNGNWQWRAPIGYINVQKEVDSRTVKSIEIDPKRFYLVQRLFNEALNGTDSNEDLTQKVNKWGLTSQNGGTIHPQLVWRILRNPFYAGTMVQGTWDLKVKGSYPKAVSEDDFSKLQLMLSGKFQYLAVPRERNRDDFPLRGYLLCPGCNKPVTASWSKGRQGNKYPYYRCNNKGCQFESKSVRADKLHEEFVEYLSKITPKVEFVELFSAIVLDVWQEEIAGLNKDVGLLDTQVTKLEDEKRRVFELAKKGIFDDTYIKSEVSRLDNELAIKRLEGNESRTDSYNLEAALLHTKEFLEKPASKWLKSPLDTRQRFQEMIFPNDFYYDKKLGFGTSSLSFPFEVLQGSDVQKTDLVTPAGFEPAISWMKTRRPRPLDGGVALAFYSTPVVFSSS